MIVKENEEFPESLEDIRKYMDEDWGDLIENQDSATYLINHLKALKSQDYENSLKGYKTFLPPRLVRAAKIGNLSPFFGAGVSIAANIPTWSALLQKLGVSDELIQEPNLENDPLTLAELLSHEVGSHELQKALRRLMKTHSTPSIVHYLLAQLSQGVYVTTNYDTLFEKAWKAINDDKEPIVITTDSDFNKYNLDHNSIEAVDGRAIVLKIHGCANKGDEELILTRSQYRRHYRTNTVLFDAVRTLMLNKHMLFVGFGHRDPEITRLVDDSIHKYETAGGKAPEYYSLQFDMKEKTPEVFAARGMLALKSPVSLDSPEGLDYRTSGLAKSLIDICGAMNSSAHESLDIDEELDSSVSSLEKTLSTAMDKLTQAAEEIELDFNNELFVQSILDKALSDIGQLAGQGVYLLRRNGVIYKTSIPSELKDPKRQSEKKLADRFYVQQAKTFKEAFVSDSAESVFNLNSTIFMCKPLGDKTNYKGLLFCAAQVGEWKKPMDLKDDFLKAHPEASFILVDSNGIVLLAPNKEMEIGSPRNMPVNESGDGNQGYDYASLHRISRRDKLITRMWQNIVPVRQDDDVYNLSDLDIYSVVSEIRGTRWKLALSKPIPKVNYGDKNNA